MHKPSDRALVLRTREGEVNAYGDLVRRYQSMVFNTCYRICGERRQAEDLAQEAFLRAFQRLHTFDPDRPFGPWIRKVAANHCYNHLQASKPRVRDLELNEEFAVVEESQSTDPAMILERNQTTDKIRYAILQLPPHHRIVIEMRHYQDLSYEEIAETLNITLSKVKTDLFRARKMLSTLLENLD